MFLITLKIPSVILNENSYQKVTLITTIETPKIGITIATLYNASGGDESMSIENYTSIGTKLIPLDNLSGDVEWQE